jgi:deoxyribonucleoside regulator
MFRYTRGDDREELLADVAEMYYEEGLTQVEISHAIGMTRSAISRMLTEARQKGIVQIHIQRPLRFDANLEEKLIEHFGLQAAHVLVWQKPEHYEALRRRLGVAAGHVLEKLLRPGLVIGLPWGKTVSATIDALEVVEPTSVRVVQLVGVLGSNSHVHNAQALVEQLARKLGGEGVYLYTPFIVESPDTARALLNNQNIREAIAIGKRCDVALLGIGTTEAEFSSLYQGGHITLEELEVLQRAGAVGDVSGHHFDIAGRVPDVAFHDYLVGIARDDLLTIPIRLGVAGGAAKVRPILGALRGGYVNVLVTDSHTAQQVLNLGK